MFLHPFAAFLFLISLTTFPIGVASAWTANFVAFTLEVPGNWLDIGGGKMRTKDGSMQIIPLNYFKLNQEKPGQEGSSSTETIATVVERIKTNIQDSRAKIGITLIRDFIIKDLGQARSLMRAVYRMNETTIVTVYFVVGSNYVVPFNIASKHDIDATTALLDPVFESLKWIGR
jgi:hypothetical protein